MASRSLSAVDLQQISSSALCYFGVYFSQIKAGVSASTLPALFFTLREGEHILLRALGRKPSTVLLKSDVV